MLIQNESHFIVYVFFCSNNCGGKRKSCAGSNNQLIKYKMKDAVAGKEGKGSVRVSISGCIAVCATDTNVMIYPQKL